MSSYIVDGIKLLGHVTEADHCALFRVISHDIVLHIYLSWQTRAWPSKGKDTVAQGEYKTDTLVTLPLGRESSKNKIISEVYKFWVAGRACKH